MKIEIKAIKGAEHPIRTESDNEKMDELVQSIKEQGLIVPIKVRPIPTALIVYGTADLRLQGIRACKSVRVEGVDDTITLFRH